jgi:hypothetical protein
MLRVVVAVGIVLPLAGVAGASPKWQAPVRLSPSDRALGPELAVNAVGDGVVVWDHEEGADCPTQPASLSCIHIVEAVTRSHGATAWGAPIEVARPGIGALPSAAIDPAGDIAIVWVHDIGQDRVLQATIRPAGGATWPNANDLSGTPLEIKNHAIALDGGGNAVAVWAQRDSTNFYVVGDLRPAAGGVWLAPVALSSTGADATAGPALALVPSGEALVAWIDGGALRVVRGNAATGFWDVPLTPAGGGINADTDVDVALNPSGDAVAVWSWRRSAAGPNIVQAAFRPAGGNWGAVVDLGSAGAGRSRVQGAINNAGSIAAVWLDGSTLKGAGRARSTGNWSASAAIATNVAASGASIAMNPAGNAVGTWSNSVTGAIRAAIRPAGGAWQPPVRVSSPASGAARVVIDAASRAVAVWNRPNAQLVFAEATDLAPTGPVLAAVHIPAKSRRGVKATFSASPRAWALPLSGAPIWRFGDGKSAVGASVKHAYNSTGTFTVSVSQSDSSGVKSTATRKVTVTSP